MQTRMGLGLGLGMTRGVGGGGVFTPNFFVDSVNGSDSNDGLTLETAKQTLASGVSGLATRTALGLAGGSYWREDLDATLLTNKQAGFVGSGNVPVIDGSDVVSTWTAEGTANVWQASVAHDGFGSDRLTVYENGNLLTRATSVAACSATPGTFVDLQAGTANPWIVKIHATGSGNPNSNGNTYEVANRRIGFFLGDNAKIYGPLETSRVIGNNGSFEVGVNADVRQVLAVYGTKHNMLAASGSMTDCIACRADKATSYELSSTWFVFYDIDVDGLTCAQTRCGVVADGYTSGGPFIICHDSTGNAYSTYTGEQIWLGGSAFEPSAEAINVDGLYASGSNVFGTMFSLDAHINGLLANQNSTPSIAFSGFSGIGSATASRSLLIENSAFYSIADTDALIRMGSNLNGANITLRNCIIYLQDFRAIWAESGGVWSSGSLNIENCIIVAANTRSLLVPAGVTYTGNNNVFVRTSGTNFSGTFNGTTYTSLAAWQTATGQDANSVFSLSVAGLFSGTVANGDFRLASTGLGMTASSLGAGLQQYWNWNSRALQSGAAPRWPVPPATLAESRTYVAYPEAWDFYP